LHVEHIFYAKGMLWCAEEEVGLCNPMDCMTYTFGQDQEGIYAVYLQASVCCACIRAGVLRTSVGMCKNRGIGAVWLTVHILACVS
jgi:hypothetical protein